MRFEDSKPAKVPALRQLFPDVEMSSDISYYSSFSSSRFTVQPGWGDKKSCSCPTGPGQAYTVLPLHELSVSQRAAPLPAGLEVAARAWKIHFHVSLAEAPLLCSHLSQPQEPVDSFSGTAAKKHHELGWLRAQKCILPKGPEVWRQGVSKPATPSKPQGENPALPLPASGGSEHSWACGFIALAWFCPHMVFSSVFVASLLSVIRIAVGLWSLIVQDDFVARSFVSLHLQRLFLK